MRAIAAAICVACASGSAAGPLSKFDDRKPELEITAPSKLEDIERCLINMDGWLAPIVYRQPDRPDDVSLLWLGPNGLASAKVELHRSGSGTSVKSWMPAKQVAACTGAQ